MSAYTPTKRSLPGITDLLQLTDSEEEAGGTGNYTEYNMFYNYISQFLLFNQYSEN